MQFDTSVLRLAAGLAVAASVADANIYGTFTSVNNQTWWVTGLTDFDQVRESRPANVPVNGLPSSPGLPGNGTTYCVPTATLNMFAYAAHHGYPNLLPGDRNYSQWQNQAYGAQSYDTATASLDLLGAVMNTNLTGGTNSTGWYTGAWITTLPHGLDVSVFKPSSYWQPRVKIAGLFAHMTGGLVSVCYGRYNWFPDGGPSGLPLLLSRENGHCVTLQRIEVTSSGSSKIWINNPAGSDSDPWNQSLFESSEISITDRFFYRLDLSGQVMSQLNVGGDLARIIDSVYLVSPQQAFLETPSGFTTINLGGLLGSTNQNNTQTFLPPPGGLWEQVVPCPVRSHFVGLSSEVDDATGRTIKHVGALLPGGVVPEGEARIEVAPNTTEILYGVDMNLFAMTPTGIDVLRPDEDLNYDFADSLSFPVGFVPGAMSFDDDDFQLVVVDRNTGAPLFFPPYAGWGGEATPVLGRLNPPVAPVGDPVMQWAHAGEGFEYIVGDTESDLVRLYERCDAQTLCLVESFRLPTGAAPAAFSPTNGGEIYITTQNGEVWCYSNETGTWSRDESAPWDGRMADHFQVSRNRSNVDPSFEEPYTNVPISEVFPFPSVANCGPADVTATGATLPPQDGYSVPDGVVDFDDLGFYLNNWLAAEPVADVTTTGATLPPQDGFGIADGVVDFDDLGFFLNAWLQGCP